MSEFFSHFHFIRPWMLLAALPAIGLSWALLRHQQKAVQWQSFIAPHLLNYLVDGQAQQVKRLPLLALLAMWILASLALAGPAWKKLPQPVHKEVGALVIIWDLSPSMKATDLKPSRVVRSRLKLFDLLKARKQGVTALISYSGEAHIVTPLTDDTDTISSLITGLHPDIMPVTGSNTEMALETAIQLLSDGGVQRGDILFVTDGIADEALPELSKLAQNSGHRITVWGIGTADGAPIPGKNGGFIKNRAGDIIIAQLDEPQLSDAAAAMGGVYVPFTNNDFDLNSFQNFSGQSLTQLQQQSERTFDKWYEHGPHLLLLILPFAAFAFRRGWLLTLSCLGLFMHTEPSQALEWQDLWLNQDQQAYKKLQNGDAASAAEAFNNPQWKGIADYKNQNYEAALENFSQQENAQDLFNQGNALAHLDNYEQAKAAYQRALELEPDFQEAKDNLDIVKQLEQLQQQQQNQDDSQQGQQDQQNQDNASQQGQQNQQNQQSDGSQNDSQQSDAAQNEQQQNADNSDSQNAQQHGEQDGENQQASEQNKQQLNDEQREALEQQYGQQGEQAENEAEQEAQQAQQEQPDDTPPENAEQQAQLAKQQADAEQSQQEANQKMAQAMQNAQPRSEEDQALEQWLRKVPDDPSGLLRNKFKYESRERQLKLRNQTRRPPGTAEPRL